MMAKTYLFSCYDGLPDGLIVDDKLDGSTEESILGALEDLLLVVLIVVTDATSSDHGEGLWRFRKEGFGSLLGRSWIGWKEGTNLHRIAWAFHGMHSRRWFPGSLGQS